MTKEIILTDDQLDMIVEKYSDVLFKKIVDKAVEERINHYDSLEEMTVGKGLYSPNVYEENLIKVVSSILSPFRLSKYQTDKTHIRALVKELTTDK